MRRNFVSPKAAVIPLASVFIIAACGGDTGADSPDTSETSSTTATRQNAVIVANESATTASGEIVSSSVSTSEQVSTSAIPGVLDGVADAALIQNGFKFLEGPVWSPSENTLYFSDIPEKAIYTGFEAGKITKKHGHATNGLAFDKQNRLLVAGDSDRSLVRFENGSASDVARTFETKKFNSPNDLIYTKNGDIYFTDPPYAIKESDSEIGCSGVYKVSAGSTSQVFCDPLNTRPNGIAVSPAGQTLYVAFTNSANVVAWDVKPDGTLSGRRDFAETGGSPDGMAVDNVGNLFVTSEKGVEVFASNGEPQGVINVAEQPTNCTFGGPDSKTLFITARTGLYSTELNIAGVT